MAGTKVTVSELPYSASRESTLWSETDWISNNEYSFSPSPLYSGEKGPGDEGFGSGKFEVRSVNLKSQASSLKPARQIPIEQVPLGARVPTKNPNRYEVDPQPEPNQATWAKLSITVKRSDGGIVDAELIRPRAWIRSVGIEAGKLLPINIEELQVKGSATVTSIDDCPEIADGEGSVVTARFITREVHVVASVDIQGPDGSIETITGTPIHPIWSVDRQEWVPLAELAEGEHLLSLLPSPLRGRETEGEGAVTAIVLSVSLSRVTQPVYNIEVHSEHVYQVGELCVVVHNACVPKVTDAKLGNLVKDLFKGAKMPNPIGTGSTADAVRNELITGLPTHGRFHSQKATEYTNALTSWLKKNPNAPHQDQLVARSLINDLRSALGGN